MTVSADTSVVMKRDHESAPVEVTVTSPFDPGFEATVRMATEVCLALVDGSTMDAPGGVLTPAVAVGVALQDRLRGVGIDVEAVAGLGAIVHQHDGV